MKKLIYLSIFTAVSMGVVSCGSPGEESTKNDEKTETVEQDTVIIEETSELMLPSLVQIGDAYKQSGLTYKSGITLPSDNYHKYNTSDEQYLILGAYWADITYCVLNGQAEDARKYLKVIKDLSENAGLPVAQEDNTMLERFEANLNNPDSVRTILIEIDEATDEFMDDNNTQLEALLIFTGGWIEGMYLGVESANLSDLPELSARVLEQLAILSDLLNELERHRFTDKKTIKLIESLKELEKYYMSIPEIANHQGSFKDISIPVQDLQTIADKIIEVHNILIN